MQTLVNSAVLRPKHERAAFAGGLLVLVAAAVIFPFVVKGYFVFQATMILAYAVALLGLNLLTGYGGQISLGHGAFFAIGAYVTAILMDAFGVPYWLTIPASGLVCLLAGYFFGVPALKLEGLYLALATFSLGVALPQLLKYKHFEAWTGGAQGIVLTKPEAPFSIGLTPDQWLYFFALVVALILFWLARRLLDSGVGRAITAIRDHPHAAESMGVDARHYKAVTFGLSAMYTGIGGSLFALAVQFVAPDSFGMMLSISLLVGIVFGGRATLSGALYGAAFILLIPNIAEQVSKAGASTVYGVVLILCVFVFPGGVAGALGNVFDRIRNRTPRGTALKNQVE